MNPVVVVSGCVVGSSILIGGFMRWNRDRIRRRQLTELEAVQLDILR